MSSQLDAEAIARLSLMTDDDYSFKIQHGQTIHRLELLKEWNIPPGSKILELGCGQGDCTTVLATAVGEEGRVVAVDPASLDYGSPHTLGEAQSHISKGPVGERITWIQQTPEDYLASLQSSAEIKAFDVAVLAHSLWYFSSPTSISSTLRALKKHVKRLLLAEWSLVASDIAGQPHVLASLTQASLECRKPTSTSNVRTVLGPKRIAELAVEAGWKLAKETVIQPGEGMLDGYWEVSMTLASSFEKEIKEIVADERERAVVLALRDACDASLTKVPKGKKGARSMDVWVSSFV